MVPGRRKSWEECLRNKGKEKREWKEEENGVN
jgi:hypothetical protein